MLDLLGGEPWCGAQLLDLLGGERRRTAGPTACARDRAEHALRSDAGDARTPRELLQQGRARAIGVRDAGDLEPAGCQAHPRRVVATRHRRGHGGRAVGRALDPDQPVDPPEADTRRYGDHARRAGLAEPAVPAGDGPVGGAENGGDPAERRSAIHLQGMHELRIELIEIHHHSAHHVGIRRIRRSS
ncbi:MAG TPA: hypothetical protein VFH76_15790 [Kribbella sp.]|nr:hypothetical protein [Kribbella sp.]